MKIPEYAYGIAQLCNVSDAMAEELWGQFVYLKLHYFDKQAFKEFFYMLLCLKGNGMVVKLFDFILQNIRIPHTTPVERFKHEWVIHFLNMSENAKFILLYALINVCEDLPAIRKLAKLLFNNREVKIERRDRGAIGFI